MDSKPDGGDFDWLRQLRDAADAKARPAARSNGYRRQAWRLRLARPNGPGALSITSKGRDALLDQDMRDAEDR